MDLIRKANLNTYPLFSLNGYITYAKLLSNYDGDTGDILFIYNDNPMHLKARFYGYDSHEIKPSINDPNRDEKKKKALDAKKRLWFLCTNNDDLNSSHDTLIKIKCGNFDKYGRVLITAFQEFVDITNLNDDELFNFSINFKMIEEGHGIPYFGGKKIDF